VVGVSTQRSHTFRSRSPHFVVTCDRRRRADCISDVLDLNICIESVFSHWRFAYLLLQMGCHFGTHSKEYFFASTSIVPVDILDLCFFGSPHDSTLTSIPILWLFFNSFLHLFTFNDNDLVSTVRARRNKNLPNVGIESNRRVWPPRPTSGHQLTGSVRSADERVTPKWPVCGMFFAQVLTELSLD